MKRTRIACLVVALAFILAAVIPAMAAEDTNLIKVGFIPAEDELPLYVADKEGLFAKEGIKVELISFASAVERDTALRAGQLDGIEADLIAAVLNVKAGVKGVVTSNPMGSTPKEGRFGVFAAPGSKIKSIADLKGVQVAISNNTIQDFVTNQLLVAGGLKEADIATIDVPKVPIRYQMLMSGQVKAAALPDPMGALAELKGATLIASDTNSNRNLSPMGYFWQTKSLDTKAETFKKFYKVYREVVTKINANPEKYRSVLVEKAKVPDEIKDTYPMQHYPLPVMPTRQDFELAQKWMIQQKLIDHPYRYEDLFDSRFVK